MLHFGDITKIDGSAVPPVDVVIGGSPCQDLSVAGKQAGLAGARSGLYMEQIRVIKEMRNHDLGSGRTNELLRPRYMVWENVPGAFSSNGGWDFAAVLEEAIRIAEPEAPHIEVPEKGWNTWGGYHEEMGGRWSVAWRVLDAQYWGVPQRRRRIALIADFGGDSAGEILFERKKLPGNFEESRSSRGNSSGDDQKCFALQACIVSSGENAKQWGSGIRNDAMWTLTARDHHAICVNTPNGDEIRWITPLECERLQGFPDRWTDIPYHEADTDKLRYKALGNSIAIPPWKWVLKRLCAQYERDATMGSLFDGIGGFPLIWEQINGKGSCLWGCEIEPFPIAVVREHFL